MPEVLLKDLCFEELMNSFQQPIKMQGLKKDLLKLPMHPLEFK